jgi:hypothetical protein
MVVIRLNRAVSLDYRIWAICSGEEMESGRVAPWVSSGSPEAYLSSFCASSLHNMAMDGCGIVCYVWIAGRLDIHFVKGKRSVSYTLWATARQW